MKLISYSIFNQTNIDFEFMFYLRGIYYNARMNKLLYPDWRTGVNLNANTYSKYSAYFLALEKICDVVLLGQEGTGLCKKMLWRMAPIFQDDLQVTHLLCRDADSITTYREAQAVQEWLHSGLGFHGITDNPVHTQPMMGGMIGIDVQVFKYTFPQWQTFSDMLGSTNLSERGSDQVLLREKIYPQAKNNMMAHYFSGLPCSGEKNCRTNVPDVPLPGVNHRLWESNLCTKHIGSAGVVEMELLRFFHRFDNQEKYTEFEKQFASICYWAQPFHK
jgi:hypothetical protein